mmetsp:Transcript_5885/g.10093  ORF Transcript_5885/g.10093 Transcript_5885/m.10093 type:complete len:219 (-) Transcript_5885:464-1120(-)
MLVALGLSVGVDEVVDLELLGADHGRDVGVVNAAVQPALHQHRPVVVLDVAFPLVTLQRDLLREALLLEVLDGVLVGVCEYVGHVDGGVARLHVVHHARAESVQLVLWCNRAERDLGEVGVGEVDGAVGDAAHDHVGAHQHKALVFVVEDEAREILSGHVGQAPSKEVAQLREQEQALLRAVVAYHHESHLAALLQLHHRLVSADLALLVHDGRMGGP